MNKQRQEAEAVIYNVMDALDRTKSNSSYYKEMFGEMSDQQFMTFIKKSFPYKFQIRPFEIEPTMSDVNIALGILKVPMLEKLNLNYLYKNKQGKAVQSKECLVGYIPLKKMKQFITKKNAMSTDISERDMKSGLLVSFDKNGITSDREMEALAINGLDNTIRELSKPRGDAMKAKSMMYGTINTLGSVRMDEIPVEVDDSLAKNLINTYMIGSQLYTNMINEDYYLPLTLKGKKGNKIERK